MITEIDASAFTVVASNPPGKTAQQQDLHPLFTGLWLAQLIGIAGQQGLAAVIPGTSNLVNDTANVPNWAANPTPGYYAYQVYANFGGIVNTTQDAPPGIRVFTSVTTSNELVAVIVNRNPIPVDYTFQSATPRVGRGAAQRLISAPVTLSPYSMTRLHFNTAGQFIDGTSYGLPEFTANTGSTPLTLTGQ